jgi:multimeric flavodoxin WrbA
MSQPIVLVTFYSRSGNTEKLALSHAVGAVQARALIRLRRVRDAAVPPDTSAEVLRMHKEYVPPAEADVLGADALVVAPPLSALPSDDEWQEFMGLLARLGREGRLAGKVGAVVNSGGNGGAGAVGHFAGALFGCGLVLVPPVPGSGPIPEDAITHGRLVAGVARALKAAAGGPISSVRT